MIVEWCWRRSMWKSGERRRFEERVHSGPCTNFGGVGWEVNSNHDPTRVLPRVRTHAGNPWSKGLQLASDASWTAPVPHSECGARTFEVTTSKRFVMFTHLT